MLGSVGYNPNISYLIRTRWWFQICLFSSLPGEDSHFDSYFSIGLVQPPTSNPWILTIDPNKPVPGHPSFRRDPLFVMLKTLLVFFRTTFEEHQNRRWGPWEFGTSKEGFRTPKWMVYKFIMENPIKIGTHSFGGMKLHAKIYALRIQTPPDRIGFFGFHSHPEGIGM